MATTIINNFLTPWTPANAETILWLDASDSTNFVLDGNAVISWLDKSGNNHHATAPTVDTRPTRTDDAVLFDGSKYLRIDSSSLFDINKLQLFIVYQQDIIATSSTRILIRSAYTSGALNGSIALWGAYCSWSFDTFHSRMSSNNLISVGQPSTLAKTLMTGVWDSFVYSYRNGGQMTVSTSVTDAIPEGHIETLVGWGAHGEPFLGNIAEVIISPIGNRKKFEAYLGRKHGILIDFN